MTGACVSTSSMAAVPNVDRPPSPPVTQGRSPVTDRTCADRHDVLQRAMLLGLDRDSAMRAHDLRRRLRSVQTRSS